ncbi:MAG TPA: nucleotidyltransferase family protein [Stellaceae bacterium]|nr:nucleotidyltransferase family protein [Stellaceae bacterium]
MLGILGLVETLDLPDCWVGAGFVRNVIWDALHERPWSASYGDVDVVYFDAGNLSPDRDRRIEVALKRLTPDIPWSVKNQARMHIANGDPPYADTADALRHWPETCTAVALRSFAPAYRIARTIRDLRSRCADRQSHSGLCPQDQRLSRAYRSEAMGRALARPSYHGPAIDDVSLFQLWNPP